jgi:hypothetical protein
VIWFGNLDDKIAKFSMMIFGDKSTSYYSMNSAHASIFGNKSTSYLFYELNPCMLCCFLKINNK